MTFELSILLSPRRRPSKSSKKKISAVADITQAAVVALDGLVEDYPEVEQYDVLRNMYLHLMNNGVLPVYTTMVEHSR